MKDVFLIVCAICFLFLQMCFVFYYLHKITIKSEEEEERILQLEIRANKLEIRASKLENKMITYEKILKKLNK